MDPKVEARLRLHKKSRDKAAIALAWEFRGHRASLSGLKIGDAKAREDGLYLNLGGAEAKVSLSAPYLLLWLADHPGRGDPDGPLWVDRLGRPLSPGRIEFLLHLPIRGRLRWDRESVLRALRSLTEELGRTPRAKEFARRFPGAMAAVYAGRVSTATNYADFLLSLGIAPPFYGPGYWTPNRIDAAFDEIAQSLGRRPVGAEMEAAYPGALHAIYRGAVPRVRCYSAYLRRRGLQPTRRRWEAGELMAEYGRLRGELDRPPRAMQFFRRAGSGAFYAAGRRWGGYKAFSLAMERQRSAGRPPP